MSETLVWCLPMVVMVLAFFTITAIIVFTVYRQKKYGAFCCLTPKMRYCVEEGGETFHRSDCPSPPPSYNMSPNNNLAPPDYNDALQDVILYSGEPTESRYTTWSNVPVLPEYSVATSENTANTEIEAEVPQRDTRDTSNVATSMNSISSDTSSDELITGAVIISQSHPSPDNETERTNVSQETKHSGQQQQHC